MFLRVCFLTSLEYNFSLEDLKYSSKLNNLSRYHKSRFIKYSPVFGIYHIMLIIRTKWLLN